MLKRAGTAGKSSNARIRMGEDEVEECLRTGRGTGGEGGGRVGLERVAREADDRSGELRVKADMLGKERPVLSGVHGRSPSPVGCNGCNNGLLPNSLSSAELDLSSSSRSSGAIRTPGTLSRASCGVLTMVAPDPSTPERAWFSNASRPRMILGSEIWSGPGAFVGVLEGVALRVSQFDKLGRLLWLRMDDEDEDILLEDGGGE